MLKFHNTREHEDDVLFDIWKKELGREIPLFWTDYLNDENEEKETVSYSKSFSSMKVTDHSS